MTVARMKARTIAGSLSATAAVPIFGASESVRNRNSAGRVRDNVRPLDPSRGRLICSLKSRPRSAFKDQAMTHAAESTPTQLPFSDAEWQTLQNDDRLAGGSIVGLMGGIFIIGLVLYLIVLWSVMG